MTGARSDRELIDATLELVSAPKRDELDSFQLHAPLEVLARAELLGRVSPSVRDAARARLAEVGERYRASAPPIEPLPDTRYDSAESALDALAAAITDGDLDGVDPPARWLALDVDPTRLCRYLAPLVRDRLAAAAHGNIWLHLVPRVSPASPVVARTCRPLVRELAREPDDVLTWHHALPDHGVGTFEAALAAPRRAGDPGTDFIQPVMDLVARTGLAAELLSGPVAASDLVDGARRLTRIAARSMLQDDPARAPYGWSHCLTLTQGVLGASPNRQGLAVAATYVLGFRSIFGTVELQDRPVTPTTSPRALVDHAAQHPDAHLVKYTVACFEAAVADPNAADLYLAAAEHLARWWMAHDG